MLAQSINHRLITDKLGAIAREICWDLSSIVKAVKSTKIYVNRCDMQEFFLNDVNVLTTAIKKKFTQPRAHTPHTSAKNYDHDFIS
jgi:hypothetical protein